MRIAVSKREHYHADIYCVDSSAAKKAIRENHVSILAIDFYLVGRESGQSFLTWARNKKLLPDYIVVTESDRIKRHLLADTLILSGYQSADGMTFIKH